MEPLVLPARVPNLLINGSSGIAVGIATKIPPHNMREVVDGLRALIRNPDISVQELMRHIPGPDFPTGWQRARRTVRQQRRPAWQALHRPLRCALPAGGELIMGDGIRQAYTEGKGGVVLRAKMHIEDGADGAGSAAAGKRAAALHARWSWGSPAG